jgi:Ca2+-binding EF-hand superfamily protein
MKKAALILIAGLFSVTGALAQSQQQMHEGHLGLLDQNETGAVDRSDYQQFMFQAFARLDGDGNDYLVESDVAGVLTAEQFAALDTDGDGRVTQDEFMAHVMADFDRADQAGTGRLE